MTRTALVTAIVTVIVLTTAGTASAQTSARPVLTPMQVASACAPPATYDELPYDALRIIGSQDPMGRSLFGDRDMLVIGGGTTSGVQLGQEYFVRRTVSVGTGERGPAPRATRTLGWLRVIAVNESTAIATVDHACGDIGSHDYLTPFTTPDIPLNAERHVTVGEPDFSSLGRILVGDNDRTAVGMGDFVLIDRGSQQGLAPGTRFSIYRDTGVHGMPLTSVGEGVVITIGTSLAQARITRTSDAVLRGDYVALRK